MKNRCLTIRWIRRAAGIAFLAAYSLAFAGNSADQSATQDPAPADFANRYAAGSIRSSEMADRALEEAKEERQAIEARFTAEQNACYSKFFVTSCVDDAKERRRAALALVRPIEIEANTFKRRAHVIVRDSELARKQEEKQADAERRAAAQQQEQAEPTDSALGAAEMQHRSSADGAQPSDAVSKRVARHEAKMARREAKKAADEKKRAENVAAYERKVRAAEQRQREIAEKKAKNIER